MELPSQYDYHGDPIFADAVERLLLDEGEYSNVSADPGGETKYGISHRQYPNLTIATLTKQDAIDIYYRDWWIKFRFTAVANWHPPVAAKVFNLAVNMGPAHAIVCLQRALRANGHQVTEDGIIGPVEVLPALQALETKTDAILSALRSEAAGYYRALDALERGRRPNKDEDFLKGWLNRAYE